MKKKLASYPDWQDWIPFVLLAGAVFVAYAGVYHNAFVYDDDKLIVHNAFLRRWRYVPVLFTTMLTAGVATADMYYRPLQILSYLITFQLAGLSTAAFHFLNLALHAANACLLLWLGRRLGFASWAVFVGALVWALHPTDTESVTYMSATADVLGAFFCLLGVAVLLPDFTPRRVALAAGCMVLGLLSKETAITFPLLAASCVYCVNKKRLELRSYVCLWPLFALAAVYVGLHLLLTPHMPQAASAAASAAGGPAASLAATNFDAFATLSLFLRLLVWPVGLHMEHDLPPYASPWHFEVLAGFIFAAGTAFFVMRKKNRASLPLVWGLLWFFAAYAPVFLLAHKAYEHWLYLPSAGLLLGAAQWIYLCIAGLPKGEARLAGRGVIAAALIVALGFGALTYAQNGIWRDPEIFYRNTLAYEAAPNFHVNLGVTYAQRGDYAKAIEQYRQAVEVKGDNALSPANRATVETDWGQTSLTMPGSHDDEALKHFENALDADPDSYSALHELGKFYAARGDSEKAALYNGKADTVRARFITSAEN